MDVLRLLTRSTKLQNKIPNSQPGSRPSAGAPTHPQLFSRTHAEATGRGVKRKRAQEYLAKDESHSSNFFSNASSDDNIEEAEQRNASSENEQVEGQVERLSSERCKEILRSHKIKVSILDRDQDVNITKRSKKSSRKVGRKETKTKVIPIYPQPLGSFRDLRRRYGISGRLLQNLLDQGYTEPTEVQLAALPLLLAEQGAKDGDQIPDSGLIDLLTVAPTGSGKTLAFLVPIINKILSRRIEATLDEKPHVSALVLAPTHELVDQITNEGRKLTTGIGVKISAMQKGMMIAQGRSKESKEDKFSAFVKSDILVSTPALISNILSEASEFGESLPSIRDLVLDEADVLLDPLFRDDTVKIWNACDYDHLQTTLWSATLGASVETLACERLQLRSKNLASKGVVKRKVVRLIAGLKDSALPNVKHDLVYAASEQGKLLAMRNLLHPSTSESSTDTLLRPPFLVFTQTISRAIALHSELLYDIRPEAGGSSRIAVLHSDLSLIARSNIMTRFRKGEIWVLITTDVLSRGVDFRGVNGVVNYDIPNSGAVYIHRAGRTGRAGRDGGVCVTFYTKEDIPYVKSVANVIAAAEKLKGSEPGARSSAMPQWLLDALPDLSKQTRKELKAKGVAARRSKKGGKTDGAATMRISTKSGYERRLENNKKQARRSRQGSQERESALGIDDEKGKGSDDEFGGFDD